MFKLVFRISLFLAIAYNLFLWRNQVKNEKDNNSIIKRIVFIDCNATKGSSIKVSHKDEFQRVEVSRELCRKLKEGEQIELIYNSRFNQYHIKGNRSSKNLFFFLCLVFILSFVNFNRIKKLIDE